MSKNKDIIEQTGIIQEALPNQTFRVELGNGHEIICYTGGRMRQNRIRLVAGDRVTVEMTPYDLNKGRIVHRG